MPNQSEPTLSSQTATPMTTTAAYHVDGYVVRVGGDDVLFDDPHIHHSM